MTQKVIERTLAVYQPASVLAGNDIGIFRVTGQGAYQGFQNILHGDDALQTAEFITD